MSSGRQDRPKAYYRRLTKKSDEVKSDPNLAAPERPGFEPRRPASSQKLLVRAELGANADQSTGTGHVRGIFETPSPTVIPMYCFKRSVVCDERGWLYRTLLLCCTLLAFVA